MIRYKKKMIFNLFKTIRWFIQNAYILFHWLLYYVLLSWSTIYITKKKKKKREVNFHDELKITYFKIIIKYIFEKKNILFKDL